MQSENNALKVPVEPLLQQFECPVCFDFMQEIYITKCGHAFCKECLMECINRKHECPNCKEPLTQQEAYRNYHGDDILKYLQDEKQKAQNNYYENVLAEIDQMPRTPIETVFQLNMRESLMQFEKAYEELKQRYEKLINKAKAQGDLQHVENLESRLAHSVDSIVRAYDDYMKQMAPSPYLLPLRIRLRVPTRNVQIDVSVPRTSTILDLKDILANYFQNQGNPIVEFSEQGNFIIDAQEVVIIENETEPLQAFNLDQGTTILYDGNLICQSDAPKVCFTKDFAKGQGLKTNYYTCKQCNFNWICEPCAVKCHEGHEIVLTVPDHVPTWACCYCVKRNTCVIPNNRSR